MFLVLLKSVTPLLLVYPRLKEVLEYPREVLAARGTLEVVCLLLHVITQGEGTCTCILLQAVFVVLLKSVTPLLLVYPRLKEVLEYPREVLAARGTLDVVC